MKINLPSGASLAKVGWLGLESGNQEHYYKVTNNQDAIDKAALHAEVWDAFNRPMQNRHLAYIKVMMVDDSESEAIAMVVTASDL